MKPARCFGYVIVDDLALCYARGGTQSKRRVIWPTNGIKVLDPGKHIGLMVKYVDHDLASTTFLVKVGK